MVDLPVDIDRSGVEKIIDSENGNGVNICQSPKHAGGRLKSPNLVG